MRRSTIQHDINHGLRPVRFGGGVRVVSQEVGQRQSAESQRSDTQQFSAAEAFVKSRMAVDDVEHEQSPQQFGTADQLPEHDNFVPGAGGNVASLIMPPNRTKAEVQRMQGWLVFST